MLGNIIVLKSLYSNESFQVQKYIKIRRGKIWVTEMMWKYFPIRLSPEMILLIHNVPCFVKPSRLFPYIVSLLIFWTWYCVTLTTNLLNCASYTLKALRFSWNYLNTLPCSFTGFFLNINHLCFVNVSNYLLCMHTVAVIG